MTTVLLLCTADHVLRDARLSDLETELEQLAMDARRTKCENWSP
jgi:hypothetical protein